MPKFACKHKPCPCLLDTPGYCTKHAAEATPKRDYARENELRKDDPVWQFYQTPAWKAVRKQYIKAHPTCEHCEVKLAEQVHHIEPVRKAWEKRISWSNLKAVCTACHKELDRIERMREGDPEA